MVHKMDKKICFLLLFILFFSALTVSNVLADTIIDNRDAATSRVGTWGVSSGSGSYGVDSVFSRKDTTVIPTFTWNFTPSQSGNYAVSMWWTYRDSRSTSVPVDIEYSGGTARVLINQKQTLSDWYVLGTYPLVAGVSYRVTVTAQPIPTSSSTTCADAVKFALVSTQSYTISATAGSGGSISPSGTVSVPTGADQTFNITPSTGYHVANVMVDGSSAGAIQSYTFYAVTSNHTIAATFAVDNPSQEIIIDNRDAATSHTGTWSVSSGGGSYGVDSVFGRNGATFTWRFTPSQSGNYEVSMWWTYRDSRSTSVPVDIEYSGGTARVIVNQKLHGSAWNVLGTYPFVAGVSYKVTVTAQPIPVSSSTTCADAVKFALVDTQSYTISATAGSGGSISPSGTVAVPNGADQAFIITPNNGYHILDVLVDGSSVGAIQSYTFYDVASNHTIAATFAVDNLSQETIIDNRDVATSRAGTWSVSSGSGSYGADSVFSRKDTTVTPTFTWYFTPSQSGNYQVSMWWTYRDSRSTSVPVDIEYSGGTARVVVNQKLNGSTWNVLGTYPFVAGVSYKVTVTAQPIPASSSTTCADAVRFYTPGNTSPSDGFTVIMLPDTQNYSESYPQIFTSQTQWIANNASTRNIVFVTHVGDVVNHWDSVTEWGRANTSMSFLDNTVPYAIAPGNHDEPTTIYNQYFPFTRYENKPWYGGHYSDYNDNSFQIFSATNMDFIIIHLAFCPAPEVITWADSVLQTYANHKAIITTHGFIDNIGNRGVGSCPDTQYIWDNLVVTNPNVYFVLCGHVHAEYYRMDIINGHEVHQFLADYQDRLNGGNGWLRIMRFVPADNKVYVETYSPWLNQYETDSDSYFAIDFQMN